MAKLEGCFLKGQQLHIPSNDRCDIVLAEQTFHRLVERYKLNTCTRTPQERARLCGGMEIDYQPGECMPIICNKCKHYSYLVCNEPSNCVTKMNWCHEYVEHKRRPEKLNRHNNCMKFEPK